jgi:pimeloyl-ACP methyl ester carboxylesterase
MIIGYERFGGGTRKLFYFHGFPGSRFQGRFIEPCAKELDLDVVCFERPGYGISEHPGKPSSLASIAEMTVTLADRLGWQKFHVFGVSGGAPYALGCASFVKSRVSSLHLGCPLGPLAEPEFSSEFSRMTLSLMKTARWIPSAILHKIVLARIARLQKGPSKDHPILPGLSKIDQELISQHEIFPVIQQSVAEAFHQGVRGAQDDLRVFLSPWKLDWKSIECPTYIWHGLEDSLLPSRFSELLAKKLPQATLKLIAGEGHYSLPIRRVSEILSYIR